MSKNKNIVELQMDFTLPPPIYGYHLTTDPTKAGRQIKVVKEILQHPHGMEVIGTEGNKYIISHSSIKFYIEE
jgi:hypothetical protein